LVQEPDVRLVAEFRHEHGRAAIGMFERTTVSREQDHAQFIVKALDVVQNTTRSRSESDWHIVVYAGLSQRNAGQLGDEAGAADQGHGFRE
jgi:hypothetical protein